jgi:outer membrane protein assembly factor BamB
VNRTRPALWILTLLLTVPGFADDGHDLLVAARNGDLAEVKRLVEGGVPVDVEGMWGTTPLALAARAQALDVIEYLLEKGADPNGREEFFGSTVLGMALWTDDPEYPAAKLILAAGADDRGDALATALEEGNVALARAAAASGAFYESELARMRASYTELSPELAEILASVESRPDPPPPAYTAEQLAGFAGDYQNPEYEFGMTVLLEDGGLVLDLEGRREALEPVAERAFRSAAGTSVRYWGRAGTIEGVSVERPGEEELRFGVGLDALVPPPAHLAEHDLAVAPVPAEPTVHWPGFRGANRSGVGDGAELPVDFDLGSGKGVAWRIGLPGLGNSSPVVWGDRIYVTTAIAEGGSVPLKTGLTGDGDEVEEATEHRWMVLAFDKATGGRVWETEVGRGVPLTKRHFKATQANSTPVTDGEHLVVAFPTAGLACLGMDGSIHWKHELGGLNAGGFNDPGLQWGFAASPILHDGRVILQVDIHDGPYIAAWDLDTGAPLWKTERPDVAPSWATPAIWETDGGAELVTNASIIRGYDPATGKELWSLSPTSVQVVASPIVGEENLYVSSGYPPARPIYAVEPGIRGHHEIEKGTTDPALAWAQERGGAYMPTPLLYRGLLYIVHHNGRLVAHDPATGGPVYRARFSAGGTCTNSPVAGNGVIYQGTEEGTLYAFAAGPEYEELAVHDFGAPLMATPAISEGMLIVRTPGELIALRNEADE